MSMPDLSFLDGLLGLILQTMYDLLSSLLDFFDIDPFPELIAGLPVSDGIGQFGALINWMLPVSTFVIILNVWLSMMLLAWFCMFFWRLIKWAE